MRYIGIGFLILIAASGCEAPLPETPPSPDVSTPAVAVSPAEAFDHWKAIAESAPVQRDVEQAFTLTGILASGSEGVAPIVAFAGDEGNTGEQRVFAVMCLSSQRDALEAHEGSIVAWTAEDQPLETRKLGTHLLGLMKSPTSTSAMETLLTDSARPVREAAMGVLLTYHPELVADRVIAFWNDPETTPAIRNQMVLGMPEHLITSYLPVYADAATDERLAQPARMRAISVLGELGNATHLGVLESCMENAPDGALKEHARGALALLQASTESASTTATE